MENGIGPQRGPDPRDQSIAELVKAMSEHTSHLVRDEVKLATMELKEKGKGHVTLTFGDKDTLKDVSLHVKAGTRTATGSRCSMAYEVGEW